MIKRTNLDRRTLSYMFHNMYNRCYREDYLEKNPQYKGCSICDEWLNDREAFYNWVAENYYIIDGEQIDLDKDILVKGNKVYSPDTCCKRQVLFHIFWQLIFHKKRQLIFHTYLVFDTHGVIRGLFVN